MVKKWTRIKNILNKYDIKGEIYLSLISQEGKIICTNSCMRKQLHLDNPRQVSLNILDIIHPININEFKKGISQLGKWNKNYEAELFLKNGHYHPMKWEVNLFETDGGFTKNYLCVGYSITDTAIDSISNDITKSDFNFSNAGKSTGCFKSEAERLNKELFSNDVIINGFIKNTPNLAWVVDEKAVLMLASDSFYNFFGLENLNGKKRNVLSLVPASVSDALYEKHKEVVETGIAVELVEITKWPNGQDFAFHVNIFPIEGADNIRYAGGHAVNLKERFAIEKQLQEAKNRLLILTRATSDAIWEWDMLTGKVFRNDALMDIVGYQQEENKGLTWWFRRIHPIDRYRVSDKIKVSTDTKQQSWEDEYRFKCADGSYKHMRDKGFIVYENGLPVKMIGSLQDVSHLKQLENDLNEEKFERQKKISETIIHVQEKERTRIGHELHDNVNQLLSTTKLFIEMISPLDQNQKDFKQKSIDYITMAIEDIRKLTKELVVPQLKNTSLTESIKSIIQDIAQTTNIEISFSYNEINDSLTSGKKLTIFRIVQEQIKNILKHSKATNVEITIKNTETATCLSIIDNGVGFNSDQSYSGIGLSNIFERARFYSGTSTIDSVPGNGCVLTVTIPSN